LHGRRRHSGLARRRDTRGRALPRSRPRRPRPRRRRRPQPARPHDPPRPPGRGSLIFFLSNDLPGVSMKRYGPSFLTLLALFLLAACHRPATGEAGPAADTAAADTAAAVVVHPEWEQHFAAYGAEGTFVV